MTSQLQLAGGALFNDRGELLVIHRNTPKRMQWEMPGGKVEIGETPEAATLRELREELGIEVAIVRRLGQRDFKEDGFTMSYLWFLVGLIGGEPQVREASFDKIGYFDWAELDGMRGQLSPNTQNFLAAYHAGELGLENL